MVNVMFLADEQLKNELDDFDLKEPNITDSSEESESNESDYQPESPEDEESGNSSPGQEDSGSSESDASDILGNEILKSFLAKISNLDLPSPVNKSSFFLVPTEATNSNYLLDLFSLEPSKNVPSDHESNPYFTHDFEKASLKISKTQECKDFTYFKSNFLASHSFKLQMTHSPDASITLKPGDFIIYNCANPKSLTFFDFYPNSPRIFKKKPAKPTQNIIVFSLSSLSRISAYTRLNYLQKYLQHSLTTGSQWLDFGKTQSFSTNNSENAAIGLFGQSLSLISSLYSHSALVSNYSSNFASTMQKSQSILSYFSKKRFKTLSSYENFPKSLERFSGSLQSDYKFEGFWDLMQGFDALESNIIRNKSYEVAFDHLRTFWNKEIRKNKFAYVHLEAAANYSQCLRRVDEEIAKFLIQVNGSAANDDEIAVWIVSDHGLEVKEFDRTAIGYFERFVPTGFLYLNEAAAKKIDLKKAKEATGKVLNRFDFFRMMKEMNGLRGVEKEISEIGQVFNGLYGEGRSQCDSFEGGNKICPLVTYTQLGNTTQIDEIKVIVNQSLGDADCLSLSCDKVFEVLIPDSEDYLYFEAFCGSSSPLVSGRAFLYKNKKSGYRLTHMYHRNASKISKCKIIKI